MATKISKQPTNTLKMAGKDIDVEQSENIERLLKILRKKWERVENKSNKPLAKFLEEVSNDYETKDLLEVEAYCIEVTK
jgi:threonine synthase